MQSASIPCQWYRVFKRAYTRLPPGNPSYCAVNFTISSRSNMAGTQHSPQSSSTHRCPHFQLSQCDARTTTCLLRPPPLRDFLLNYRRHQVPVQPHIPHTTGLGMLQTCRTSPRTTCDAPHSQTTCMKPISTHPTLHPISGAHSCFAYSPFPISSTIQRTKLLAHNTWRALNHPPH